MLIFVAATAAELVRIHILFFKQLIFLDYRLLRAKSNNIKSFLDKTLVSDSSNPKIHKNFTNPILQNDLITKNSQFIPPEIDNNSTTQEEIDLNIEDSFYKKVEWANEGTPQNQEKQQQIKPLLEKQPTTTIEKYTFETPDISKNDIQLKNFSKDLKESLKKLDMIIAEKKLLNNKPTNKKEKSEIKLEKKTIFKPIEEFKLNMNIEESPSENIMKKYIENQNPTILPNIINIKENNDQEDLYKNSKESLKMQEIIKEAHNQLFDPNFLSQIDPATYTNPLFLIGFHKKKYYIK